MTRTPASPYASAMPAGECVRHLRNWLADPPIPDEMRRGDAELLARLQAHLKGPPPPRVHVLTWE